MIHRTNILILIAIISLSLLMLSFYPDRGNDEYKIKKQAGITDYDTYLFQINRLILPLSNDGVIANVDLGNIGDGRYDGEGILFSSGFMMSGLNGDSIWSNGIATSSRIQDYLPGKVGGTKDPRVHFYAINSKDDPFGSSWQEWKDAVDLGAYFYDGDKDGLYNPVDKNANGTWDSNEDRPDLLGDETVWCVYNDAVPDSNRAFRDQHPMGIEIRQTMWGYADTSYLGNVVFVRYSINNTGTVSDVFDSVYFGPWADVDIGGSDGYTDDLTGCDTLLDAGFTYNDGSDPTYGNNPPCFIIDFFQEPWSETNNPDDIAFNVKGKVLGIDTIHEAVNLPMTSFIQYESSVGDPDNAIQVRNYLLGNEQRGEVLDPCTWVFGEVLGGVNCSDINPKFWYSGDPVTSFGWIAKYPTDVRQMSGTGPFKLEKDKPIDIIIGYVVGRGSSALQSVNLAKKITRQTKFNFHNNYKSPSPLAAVHPLVTTNGSSITLTWETGNDVSYRETGRDYDLMFESYDVFMHETDSLGSGYLNKVLIASYDVANDINNVYMEDSVNYSRTLIYKQGFQLDSSIYSNPEKGRIRLTITTDPFTGHSLTKGKPYLISIVSTAYNREELKQLDGVGNYLISKTASLGMITTSSPIISDGVSSFGIVAGKDIYNPSRTGIEAEHYDGSSKSILTYDVVDKSLIKNNSYEVSFFQDSNNYLLDLYYKVTDLNTNSIVLDSLKEYDINQVYYLFDGVVINLNWIVPGIISKEFIGDTAWFNLTEHRYERGIFYMGKDVVDSLVEVNAISDNKSDITNVGDMKRVELRFGQPGKAYRYIRTNTDAFNYAGDSGFVDVPFQVWVKDDYLALEYQLAVGFTEYANPSDTFANADGIYDPGFYLFRSKEYIIIFNDPYDPTGNQYVYTGKENIWANLTDGYSLLRQDPRYTDSLWAIAKSPWFNALYVAGLERTGDPNTPMTGTYAINVSYPLTTNDKYRFTVNSDLTTDEEKDLFNKINVFPNPLFLYNPVTGYTGEPVDEPYVTFSYLPNEVTIRIYSLSGMLIKTLRKDDTSPFMKWNLLNEYNRRVASGMYLAIVSNPQFGKKVLKFAVIIPEN